MDQYRKSADLPSLGILSRLINPLNETDAVFDVMTGNNGTYAAGAGYDLCTGIGSPSMATFMQSASETLVGLTAPPNPVDPGTPVTLATISQDPNATYQWSLNGTAIPGATNPIYRLGSVGAANAGDYSVAVTTTAFLTLNYNVGTLSVNAGAPSTTTRLTNISTRAQVGTGANLLIPGFVLVGSGTDTLLIRAVGPGLQQFSVSGVLAQPTLSLFDSNGNMIASNQGWANAPFPSELAKMSSAVGAFALAPGSADCVLLAQLPAGAYTVQVSGVSSTTGVALAEIYEVSSTGPRLVNISTRAQVGTGSNILIPGFYISGSGSEQLLVRGDGPGLAQFAVAGALSNPTISVYSGQSVVALNTGWTTGPDASDIASVSASVGAFAFEAGSADSATVVNLGAGPYTVQLSGVGGTTGVGLAEIYEVP
jgi:hypothetical protein